MIAACDPAASVSCHGAPRVPGCRPVKDLLDLTGKVAIGNGDIGRGSPLGLAHHGADLVVASRNEQGTEAVVGEVEAMCKEPQRWRSTTRATH